MLTPIRKSSVESWDDYILGAMLLGIGAWRVILAIVQHESFGTEPTIAAIMTTLGIGLLIATRVRD